MTIAAAPFDHRTVLGLLASLAAALLVALPAAAGPLNIVSPGNGVIASAGQTLKISVNIESGLYPDGVALMGQQPLGFTAAEQVTGPTLTFALTIPADTRPGWYSVAAVGLESGSTQVTSTSINIGVERADMATGLTVDPPEARMLAVGARVPLTVVGEFPGGLRLTVTQSPQLRLTSDNVSVLTVGQGSITAVGTGEATLNVQYGAVSVKVPVTVPAPAAAPTPAPSRPVN